MWGLQMLLFSLIIVLGMIYLFSLSGNKKRWKIIARPLATFLIVLLALLQHPDAFPTYKLLVLGGLLAFLFSDLGFVLHDGHSRVSGYLMAIGLVLFGFAFSLDPGPYFIWEILLLVAVYMVIFLVIFLRNAKTSMLAVFMFAILLSFFMWQAAGRAWYLGQEGVAYAFYGAVLMVISFTLTAYNDYVRPFRAAPVISTVMYWPSLCFIALSV
jgi:hypothetical protein